MRKRRNAIHSEISRLKDEQARLVAAIAVAGDVEALAQALREREARREELRAELSGLDRTEQFTAGDLKRIERELRQRVADWRELLDRQADGARQVVSCLLDGRVVCTPDASKREYTLAGRVKYDQLLSAAVPTVGMVPVQGFNRLRNASDSGNLLLLGIVDTAA